MICFIICLRPVYAFNRYARNPRLSDRNIANRNIFKCAVAFRAEFYRVATTFYPTVGYVNIIVTA